jgi:endonuclease VIII
VPEGDTIHRTARTLHAALAGRTLVRFEAPRLRVRPFAEGTVVEAVEARGKHCLVRFDDGRVLHTHMRMTGSWHLYRPGERWRKQRGAARVVLEVAPAGDREGWVAVCFAAPVVELVDERAGPVAAHLGPDLCHLDADLDEAARRLGQVATGTELGDALLDQRVAAGIGNVYKSEACFAVGLDPFTPVAELDEGRRRSVITAAARQLRANLGSIDRTTYGSGGLAVYGRADRPCRRCGTAVRRAAQGQPPRSTYWCPRCQTRP